MRLRHPSGRIVHLSCGISLDQADSFSAAVARLDAATTALRARFGTGTLGVALRLPCPLAAALADDGRARTRLRNELDARGLEVVTLSGVPDAEGGGENSPDWTDPGRLRNTLELARILVDLLPFKYLAYFPAAVFLGKVEGEAMYRGLLVEAAWVVGLIPACRIAWARGVRRYSGFGG